MFSFRPSHICNYPYSFKVEQKQTFYSHQSPYTQVSLGRKTLPPCYSKSPMASIPQTWRLSVDPEIQQNIAMLAGDHMQLRGRKTE